MLFEKFQASLSHELPPAGIDPLLEALWYDAKGDWEKSHNIAQDIESKEGALIHAYLHRKEGDLWNADYWYAKAGKKMYQGALEDEWISLVKTLL